jgi:hypothetical protein
MPGRISGSMKYSEKTEIGSWSRKSWNYCRERGDRMNINLKQLQCNLKNWDFDIADSYKMDEREARSVLEGFDEEEKIMDQIVEWCENEIALMQHTIEKKFCSKLRKERLKCQIIGIEKVLAQIRRLN